MTTYLASVNEKAIAVFAVVVGVTMIVTYIASKRISTATDFWAAGRALTGPQNGLAIAGDYMSAASFLGIAGLIFVFGFDGFLYCVGFLVAFLAVLFLLAEQMRNSGRYTFADVLAYRLKQPPARSAAALGTLAVVAFYLIAQMVGAGVIIEGLVGISFSWAVILTGAFMVTYIVLGGMLATSWVQIIKAVLMLCCGIVLTVWVLSEIGWNPIHLFRDARAESSDGAAYLQPGLFLSTPLDTVSLGLGLVLGTAGLPHILMRFFTVPDAKASRRSVIWAMVLIGAFYLMTTALGFGSRAILGKGGESAVGETGNFAVPTLADKLGGDVLLAIVAGVAFATILAVVAGLVISASGAVAHDVWSNVVRRGRDSEHEEVWVAKVAAFAIGAIAIGIAIIGGASLNVSFMVGLAFAVAASANFPALLLALTWRRFNTTGAVVGVLFGVISSVALVVISPTVWPGPDSEGGALSWYSLANPGIISIPLGFVGCFLGTMLAREPTAEAKFDELKVRSETGIGADPATGTTLTGGGGRRRAAAAATATMVPRM
jgi:cation/acetate symporter